MSLAARPRPSASSVVFRLGRSLLRAVRVLLTCVALTLAMPVAVTALPEQLSASMAVASMAVASMAVASTEKPKSSAPTALSTQRRARTARVRPQRAPARDTDSDSEPALTKAPVGEIRAPAPPAFVLNCSWLC